MLLNEIGLWITGLSDEQYAGQSWCRFGCGIPHVGSRSLTDGTWIWPEGLAHYVREHGILLPDEFVTQALSRGTPLVTGWSGPGYRWHLLQVANERGTVYGTAEPANPSFWIQWCSARRSRATIERLQRGCTGNAQRGMHICAGHFPGSVNRDPRARFAREFYKVLTEQSAARGLRARFPRCYQSPFEARLRSKISRIHRYLFGARTELVGSNGERITLGRKGLFSLDKTSANQRQGRRAQGQNR